MFCSLLLKLLVDGVDRVDKVYRVEEFRSLGVDRFIELRGFWG
jgi:hypothetical protein